VAGLAVSPINADIVLVDSVTPTIFIVDENSGAMVNYIECKKLILEPSDISVSAHGDREFYYVCDFKGHAVVVLDHLGNFVRRIGNESITNFPNGIDISSEGDVLVGDSHGNQFHVAIFSREGRFLTQVSCPHVKVSRCCGLKITSDGYVITLAKNNHHVLVLDTLYIM
jgi:tripartite motif-containing protein 2/3